MSLAYESVVFSWYFVGLLVPPLERGVQVLYSLLKAGLGPLEFSNLLRLTGKCTKMNSLPTTKLSVLQKGLVFHIYPKQMLHTYRTHTIVKLPMICKKKNRYSKIKLAKNWSWQKTNINSCSPTTTIVLFTCDSSSCSISCARFLSWTFLLAIEESSLKGWKQYRNGLVRRRNGNEVLHTGS